MSKKGCGALRVFPAFFSVKRWKTWYMARALAAVCAFGIAACARRSCRNERVCYNHRVAGRKASNGPGLAEPLRDVKVETV